MMEPLSSEVGWLGAQGTAVKYGGLKQGKEKSIKEENILSRVRGSVTNNSGFWIA
jgi:hypothetical protein